MGFGMFLKFFQPFFHIFEGQTLGNVVHQKCPNCPTVICAGDCAVALLTCRIPDLRLDELTIGDDATSRKFNTYRGFGLKVEFVTGESGQQVRFSNARITLFFVD